MKRLVLSMVIVVFVVFVGGAAFAAIETRDVVVPADPPRVFEEALTGATTPTVTGDISAIQLEMGDTAGDLGDFLDKLTTQSGEAAKVAMVSFGFAEGSNAITYSVAEGEYLYNFQEKAFYVNVGGGVLQTAAEAWANPPVEGGMVPAAGGIIEFNVGEPNPYDSSYPSNLTASNGVTMVSVKDSTMLSGGGGGCSALSIAALALFLLPALGLIRRKK